MALKALYVVIRCFNVIFKQDALCTCTIFWPLLKKLIGSPGPKVAQKNLCLKKITQPFNEAEPLKAFYTVPSFLFSCTDDEELTCNVCDRAFSTPRQLQYHQHKKRHWG